MYGEKILSADGQETLNGKKYSISVGLYEEEGKYNYYERWHIGMGAYVPELSKVELGLTQEEAIFYIQNLRSRRFFCKPSYLNRRYGKQWVIDAWYNN